MVIQPVGWKSNRSSSDHPPNQGEEHQGAQGRHQDVITGRTRGKGTHLRRKLLRRTFDGFDRSIDDAGVCFGRLEGEGSDDFEHGHVVIVVKVEAVLKGRRKAGLSEGGVVPVVASFDRLVEGKDRNLVSEIFSLLSTSIEKIL